MRRCYDAVGRWEGGRVVEEAAVRCPQERFQ